MEKTYFVLLFLGMGLLIMGCGRGKSEGVDIDSIPGNTIAGVEVKLVPSNISLNNELSTNTNIFSKYNMDNLDTSIDNLKELTGSGSYSYEIKLDE